MTVDLQFIATSLLTLFSMLLGWLGRELWQAVQKLRSDLSDLEVKLGTDYVRYDRLRDAMAPVMEALTDIRSAMTHKQDKP